MESGLTLNEFLMPNVRTDGNGSDDYDTEFSNLYGRRAYCKDLGLSGKEFRQCKKRLRQADKGLTHAEKKERAIARKSGSGLTAGAGVQSQGGVAMPPPEDIPPTLPPSLGGQDPFRGQDTNSGNKTAIIIGVSVGIIGLTILTIYLVKRMRKKA